MKPRKKFTIFIISLISCLFTGVIIDLACGPEYDPYDYYVSFFHNNVQGEHNYGSFYLCDNYVFDETEPESEADINSQEWAADLGNDVKQADVKKAMYELAANDDSVIIHNKLIAYEKLPDSLKNNSFLKAITSGNHNSALLYYQFAKSVEREANSSYNPWNATVTDTLKLHADGAEALKRAKAEDDKFIKLRYFYQAERLLHYNGDFKQAMDVYDHFLNYYPSNSHVKGWALSLKAGEERRLGHTVQAAYLFSKVFALYPERRVQAYKNYNYCSVKADDVAALAANDDERAFIYAIDGFSNPELNLNHLKKVYGYAPSSEMVGVLLVREINKLEQIYLTPKLQGAQTGNYEFYKEDGADTIKKAALVRLHLLQNFCIKLSEDHLYPEPGLGYMAAAYLAWMEGGHADEGLALLAKLDNQHLSDKLNDQRQLVKLLLSAQKIEKLNDVNEAELLPALQWLNKKVSDELIAGKAKKRNLDLTEYDYSKFAASSRDFYGMVLSEAYLKQGDTVKAALCILKSETTSDANYAGYNKPSYSSTNRLPEFWLHYLRSGQILQLISIEKSPQAQPYLKFLSASLSKTSENDLYDLLGTAYLREHNYSMAVTAFKNINTGQPGNKNIGYVDPNEAADPFINQLPDYPKVFLAKSSKPYNKLMFAAEMLSLQNKAATDPKNAAASYFRMATGLYNASHYGNSYYLISYDWSGFDYGRANRYSYDNDYVRTIGAEKYFLKARLSSNSAEFKAKCTFMAAKCRQKQIPAPNDIGFGDTDDAYDKAERNNPYFRVLQKNYSKTAFYKLAVSECSYLRDFLKAGSKK